MLIQAIESYNESAGKPIVLRPTRDGRVTAVLPLVGREVLVQGNITHTKTVSASDIALVCKEARLAMAAPLALLDAALEQAASSESAPSEPA